MPGAIFNGGGFIVKTRFNITIEQKKKDSVQLYVHTRKMLGENVADGMIIEEALELYGIEDRCQNALKKVQAYIKAK